MLDLDLIRIDGGTQSRVELNQDTVSEYAEAFKSGAQFPAVTVFFDGAWYWLADGFHRYFGAKNAGLTQIYENVIPGTQREAKLFSFKANATHGLRRTNADKRKAVEAMLADAEWSQWSDNQIAKACGVGNKFVGDVRRAIFVQNKDASILGNSQDVLATRTVERNGTTYQQNTSNIGKTKPKPPEPSRAADGLHKLEVVKSATLPASSTVSSNSSAEKNSEPSPASHSEYEDCGPSDEEIAWAEAEEKAEIESLRRIAGSDDKIAAALAEAKQLREEVRVLKSLNDGKQNTINEQIRMIKSLQRQVKKLEQERAAA